jgi:hypothetical protein
MTLKSKFLIQEKSKSDKMDLGVEKVVRAAEIHQLPIPSQ